MHLKILKLEAAPTVWKRSIFEGLRVLLPPSKDSYQILKRNCCTFKVDQINEYSPSYNLWSPAPTTEVLRASFQYLKSHLSCQFRREGPRILLGALFKQRCNTEEEWKTICCTSRIKWTDEPTDEGDCMVSVKVTDIESRPCEAQARERRFAPSIWSKKLAGETFGRRERAEKIICCTSSSESYRVKINNSIILKLRLHVPLMLWHSRISNMEITSSLGLGAEGEKRIAESGTDGKRERIDCCKSQRERINEYRASCDRLQDWVRTQAGNCHSALGEREKIVANRSPWG